MVKKNDNTKELKAEVAKLKRQVASLQTDLDKAEAKKTARTKRSFPWRSFGSWSFLALATALLVAGNLLFWTGNTIVNTDRYVAAVGPLIQKPEIQSAIADYTTKQIFNNVDVQSYVTEALPPKAEFLAPQLTSQLQTQTQNSIQTLLKNQKVQIYWYSSLERRHDALINFSKSYQGNGTIEVSDIYGQLSKRLDSTKLSFLANKQLPDKVSSIQVTTVGWLPALHKVANNIGLYQTIATALLLIFSVASVMLAKRRRRAVIRLGLFFAAFMLATLLAIRISGGVVSSKVDPAYQSAVHVAYNTIFHSLVTQTNTLLLASLLVVLVAWLSGPYMSATAIKYRFNQLLAGRLHHAIFAQENSFTLWVGQFKRVIQWAIVLLVAIIMLIVQLSPSLVIIYGISMLVAVALVELLASETSK